MFPPSASGDVAPIAQITGSMTGLISPQGIAVWNGEIYVVQTRSISVFPLTGNGNILPRARSTTSSCSVHLGVAHGEIYVVDRSPRVEVQVKVFPASATGDTEPTRILRWTPAHGTVAYGIAIRGGELLVSTESTVDALPADGNGPVTPLRSLSLQGPLQLVAFRNELYVADWMTSTMQVFPADAVGSAAPTRTLRGPSTQLAEPLAVFVDRDPRPARASPRTELAGPLARRCADW